MKEVMTTNNEIVTEGEVTISVDGLQQVNRMLACFYDELSYVYDSVGYSLNALSEEKYEEVSKFVAMFNEFKSDCVLYNIVNLINKIKTFQDCIILCISEIAHITSTEFSKEDITAPIGPISNFNEVIVAMGEIDSKMYYLVSHTSDILESIHGATKLTEKSGIVPREGIGFVGIITSILLSILDQKEELVRNVNRIHMFLLDDSNVKQNEELGK